VYACRATTRPSLSRRPEPPRWRPRQAGRDHQGHGGRQDRQPAWHLHPLEGPQPGAGHLPA
jgi:hypothetical protein